MYSNVPQDLETLMEVVDKNSSTVGERKKDVDDLIDSSSGTQLFNNQSRPHKCLTPRTDVAILGHHSICKYYIHHDVSFHQGDKLYSSMRLHSIRKVFHILELKWFISCEEIQ